MTGETLKRERSTRGWTQTGAAYRLGVSQPYVAMLERGQRRVTPQLAKRALNVFGLPPTALPPLEVPVYSDNSAELLASEVAALGYPGFAYLRPGSWEPRNPAEVLLAALAQDDLEPRLFEALPWLVLRYAPFDRDWLVREAKLRDLQNRLGFVVTLARRLAERRHDHAKVQMLQVLEAQLERSRLAREDALGKTLREPRRRWLAENRPEDARHWNLLTDWGADTLRYAV